MNEEARTIPKPDPMAEQIDGNHYKKLKIQPVEYIHTNNIGYVEGSAIKYLTRWRDKGGIKDLEKAIHIIQMLIAMENKTEHLTNQHKIDREYNTMTTGQTIKKTIPHLALRRQWLDDMEKDINIVWQAKTARSDKWEDVALGKEPYWNSDNEYRRKPAEKKKTYMLTVHHKNIKPTAPFAIVLPNLSDIPAYLNTFNLVQLGEVVERTYE